MFANTNHLKRNGKTFNFLCLLFHDMSTIKENTFISSHKTTILHLNLNSKLKLHVFPSNDTNTNYVQVVLEFTN